MKSLDLDTWPRLEHFTFYKTFSQPYFNITVELEVGELYALSKRLGVPFSHCYLFCLSQAVNKHDSIRYRMKGEDVVIVDNVFLSTVFTIEDDTFRFVPLKYHDDLASFSKSLVDSYEQHKDLPLLNDKFAASSHKLNQVHVSVLPWFRFSSFSHARSESAYETGVPKFVFGQYAHSSKTIPLNIEVHHALMDGLDISTLLALLKLEMSKL